MPWRSVTSAMPQPWQPPPIRSITTRPARRSARRARRGAPPWDSLRPRTAGDAVVQRVVVAGLGGRRLHRDGGVAPASAARNRLPHFLPDMGPGRLSLSPRSEMPDNDHFGRRGRRNREDLRHRGEPCASAGDVNRRTAARPSPGTLTKKLAAAGVDRLSGDLDLGIMVSM